jgi:peptide deformylase
MMIAFARSLGIFLPAHALELDMSLLDIVIYPDEVLTTPGRDVETVDADTRRFIDSLADTMYDARGVGLAAQQVGDLRRICVIDITEDGPQRDSRENLLVLVNPRVVETRGKLTWSEGCLSFPDLYEDVERAAWVRVDALDRDGKPFSVEGDELLGVALQHEIDHLDGVLFTERMSRLKRRMALKRYKKILDRLSLSDEEAG